MHALLLAKDIEPAGHTEHTLLPANDFEPAVQARHALCPAAEYEPAVQGEQAATVVEPLILLNVPALQFVNRVPDIQYPPNGHTLHTPLTHCD